MADVTLNRISELLRSVLELLWTRPGGLAAREIMAFLPEIMELTEEERGYSPTSNVPRYERYVRLATIPLVRAGWLVKSSRGRWYITEEGRAACRQYQTARDLYREALRRYEESTQSGPAILTVLEEAQEKAWEQIRGFLQQANRIEFQTLVVELLIAMGYHVAWIAPPEKDRGHIDLVVNVDPLGAKGPRIYAQLSQKGQPVTVEGLKSFLSALGSDNHGLLVSTGGFTSELLDKVQSDTALKITLLDMEGFFDLWIKYYQQLSQEAHRRLPLKAVYFLDVVN
ncbi:MAG: restriction endonuclease [Bacteroidota bacterium]